MPTNQLGWRAHVQEDLYEVGGSFSTADGTDVAHEGASGRDIQERFPWINVSPTLLAVGDVGWYQKGRRETHAEAEERAAAICEWLRAQPSSAGREVDICLVLHGDLLGMILRELLGAKPTTRFLHYNTAMTYLNLDTESRQTQLLFHNQVEHLNEDRELITGGEMLKVIA